MSKKKQEEQAKRKRLIGVTTITFTFVLILWVVLPHARQNNIDQSDSTNVTVPASSGTRHPLTGFPIADSIPLPNVYGVMIDNHPDARPQSGLDQAFLVIEAPVEGGITRMLAFFFEDQTIEQIGPVRSARPYFLEWNNELDALHVHVGGSQQALDAIATGGTLDLNQYWFDRYFWRSYDRYAPYNVYTSSIKLADAFHARTAAKSGFHSLYETWIFNEISSLDVMASPATPSEIVLLFSIRFSPLMDQVTWTFDNNTKRYLRAEGGQAHLVSDGSQIAADNIAVLVTEVTVIDEIGRRSIRTTGEGDALIFQDGRMIEGGWKKPSESDRLRFYNVNGREVVWNAGITWVEVVPRRSDVAIP